MKVILADAKEISPGRAIDDILAHMPKKEITPEEAISQILGSMTDAQFRAFMEKLFRRKWLKRQARATEGK